MQWFNDLTSHIHFFAFEQHFQNLEYFEPKIGWQTNEGKCKGNFLFSCVHLINIYLLI